METIDLPERGDVVLVQMKKRGPWRRRVTLGADDSKGHARVWYMGGSAFGACQCGEYPRWKGVI